MPKEASSGSKSGGIGGDGLDQAAEQIAQIEDAKLAALFIEANRAAKTSTTPEIRELFIEEKAHYEALEHAPDPDFLKRIYDSLTSVDIHHKKLLEEGEPTNAFSKFIHKIKRILMVERAQDELTLITPNDWKYASFCHKQWKKQMNSYLGDFASLIDLWLRDSKISRYIYKVETTVLSFIAAISVALLVFFSGTVTAHNSISTSFFKGWSSLIFYSSTCALIFSLTPPIFLITLWFVNVNRLHTSRNFHFFLFFFTTLAIVAIGLAIINTGLFYLIGWRWRLFR
ncbi:hypothetical protein MHC_05230 [Mycoplasma haemocanis str. Illinois]|uniref:Uncharacterized protein n=1 Tax=Mycoplasma haemocanis (strain Illinois) TaxID=1111676 RepID=H6N8C8_MYCHN|nr:hypothetical protein [Mycoplasma haemocanis]AEW45900.1 hypothetical protein MHC_05230 [Mycoplasma haemocanis str. Illinois]